MAWLFRKKAEFSDGEIDLIPVYLPPAEKDLGFGREREWKITLHGKRQEIGRITWRDGDSRGLYYFGHIGYHIDSEWRGHKYAEKACRLIVREIRRSGKSSVIITCDPDNLPSRKTCEALGCLWESEVQVDPALRERYDISAVKERYIWRID